LVIFQPCVEKLICEQAFLLFVTHQQSDVDMHNTSPINYFQAFVSLCQKVTNTIRKNSVVFAHCHSGVAPSFVRVHLGVFSN